jgi:uncharacterized protein (TIGR03437 family)
MIGREQTINIGDLCGVGNTIHEIGHAVGLFHEQSRQDRDLFLKTVLDNADKRTLSNFNQQLADADDIGTYDHTSIMHYDIFGFSRNGLPVFETIPPGIPVSQRDRLSPADIAAVKKMYGWPVDKVTISTNPFGLRMLVDGENVTSPASFAWEVGSKHTVFVDETYDRDGYHYVFAGWNDGGEKAHAITVAPDMPVYTANFIRHGLLSIAGGANGTVTVEPASQDGYYPEGTVIEIRATPRDGYQFREWSGVVFTSHGLSQNPVRITMRAPSLRYFANFTTAPITTVTSEPAGLRVLVDGITITTPRNYLWAPESKHEVNVEATTQAGGLDTYRNVFRGWSDDGEASHSVKATEQSQVFAARFQTQYLVARASVVGGSLDFNPSFTDGYYDLGTALQLVPSAVGVNRFVSWVGDATGSDTPGHVLVDDHKLVGATFQAPGTITSVVNAATKINLAAVAPGELVVISGLEIGPEDGHPKSVAVMFDQVAAIVVAASRNQVTAIVPASVADRSQTVITVALAGVAPAPRLVGVLPAIPGVFTVDESGKGQARAWNEDGAENNKTNPAVKGSAVVLLATLPSTSETVTARVAGRDAVVDSATNDDTGIAQVRFRLPQESPSGPVPVVIRIGNSSSLGTVFLHVR